MATKRRDLRTILASGQRFDIETAIYVVVRAARAFVRNHHEGVLSPSRIFVAENGDIEIGSSSDVVPELGYLAPELFEAPLEQVKLYPAELLPGNRVRITVPGPPPLERDWACAAVFSLGCILWELLTGHPLFNAETDDKILFLIRESNVPEEPSIPPKLGIIINKALARRARNRYQNPALFADALTDLLAGTN